MKRLSAWREFQGLCSSGKWWRAEIKHVLFGFMLKKECSKAIYSHPQQV
jgi:hypothetical protein